MHVIKFRREQKFGEGSSLNHRFVGVKSRCCPPIGKGVGFGMSVPSLHRNAVRKWEEKFEVRTSIFGLFDGDCNICIVAMLHGKMSNGLGHPHHCNFRV